ncbi:MAG: hypothetical protein O2945_18095 [Planctomycetota bacterium]|nr:hypothetical protein [Planctomycetota bacterium]
MATPITLYEVTFSVAGGFSSSTQVNFTRNGGATNLTDSEPFDFQSQSITLTPTPSVSIAGTTDGAEAGPTNGLFTVTQSATTGTNTVVNFSVAGAADDTTDFNIATAGNVTYDAGSNTGTVTILAGQTSATIPIVVLDGNTTVEATEAVSITLTGINSGDAVLGAGTTDSIDITDNDTATFTVEDVTVNEGDGTATFTISLNNPIDTAANIDFSYGGGTAAGSGGDYDSATDVAMFAPNSTIAQTVTVAITNDDLVELSETFTVSLAVNSGTALGTRSVNVTDQATGTITDNDTATFTIGDVSIGEGGTTATFTVSLDKAIDTAATINVSYAGGTATGGGTDYDSATDQVMYSANTTGDRTVTVAINNDNLVELAETFIASLAVSGSLGARSVNVSDQATGTINDNDTATFTIEDVSVNEGDGTATFTVSLSNPIDINASIDVNYSGTSATGGGTDFDSTTDTVTFNSGTNSDQTVTVAINDDDIVEATESFAATLAVNAGTVLGARSFNVTDAATGTITDNDTATFTIGDATASEEDGTMTFTIALDKAIDTDITLDVTFTPDSATSADFTTTTQQVTFPAGDNSSRTVMVPLTSDAIVEGDETFNVDLSVNTGMTPTGGRAINTTDGAVGTITDVDTATVSIAQTTDGAETDSPTAGRFTVTLSNPSSVDTVVSYSVAGTATADGDYTALSGTVTISANSTSQTIDVTVLGDDIVEDDESVMVTLTGFTARDPQVTLGTTSATVTITDDDAATITIGDASVTEGGDLTFTVSTDKVIDTNVTIDVTFADVSTEGVNDFSNGAQQITLNASTSSQTVTVSTVNDTIVEGAETLTATISLPAQSLGGRSVTGADSGTGTINDNDTAVLGFDMVSSAVNEAVAGGMFNVIASLFVTANGVADSGTVDGDVTIQISDLLSGTALRGTDYTSAANPQTLTFAGVSGNATQNYTLMISDDGDQESNETINLALIIPTGPATIDLARDDHQVTIIDDDTPSISVAPVAGNTSVDENSGTNLVYRFTRDGDANTPLTVNFSISGTAGSGDFTVDDSPSEVTFSGTTGTLILGTGVKTFDLNITPTGDNVVELDETVLVNVEAQTSGSIYNVGVPSTGTGTITNDDQAVVSISTESEAEGTALSYTVSLSNPVDVAVSATSNTADGTASSSSDYTAISGGTVTFGANSTTGQTVTVNTSSDNTVELDETLSLILSSLSASGRNVIFTGAASTITGAGTITNDDQAVVSISDVTVNEADGTLTFTLTSSNPIDIPVDIRVSYADVTAMGTSGGTGGDYDNDSDTVTLAANTTLASVTVVITEDVMAEEDETFTASLSTATSLGGRVVDLSDTATGTITDNDAIRVSVAVAPATVGEESGVAMVYTFTATSAPASDVTVSFDVTGTATFTDDYTVTGAASFDATSGTVVIPMGMISAEVRITPVDDMDTEGTVDFPDETVILTLTDTSVAYNLDPPTSATGNITDDEAVASPSIVNLNDGVNDNVELIIDGGSYVVRSTSGPAMEFFRRAISSVTKITINGGDNDNDVISINFANGNPVPPVNPLITSSGGITINGGAGGNDTVTLDNVGSSFTTHTYDYTNANDGTITLNDGTSDTTINFTGLEPIVNDGTATDIIFNLPTSADDASLEDSGTASDGLMSLVSNNGTFEATTFVVPTSSLTINAGSGDDTVTFNSADDALVPNDSSNVDSQTVVINGDAGDDVLIGSSFNDVMNGGAGNDVVNGRSGNDTLRGDADDDTLLGGSDDDNLFGGDGDDRIKGQGGTDTVGGGAGNDEIDGGTGVSSLREEGNVNLTIRSSGDAIILEGLGTDIITGTYVSVVLVGGSSGNQLDASGYAGVVTLDGAGGDDTLIGTSNADSLIGGAGTDRAVLQVRGNVAVTDLGVFGPGGDFLSDVEQLQIEIDDPTGAKVDASTYTLGRVTVIGGDGADTIIGSAQNDFLNGRGGRDQIFGGDGNDRLLGGGSNDLLVGGNGKDTLLGNSGVDTLSGGEGNDRLVGGNNRTVLREENFSGDITVTSNGEAASISGLGVDILQGTFKDLELTGDDGPNRIDASGFNYKITLNGGGGDDTLLGGSQGDSLDGGDGVDQIQQTVDLEQILTDTLVTGRGADTLSSIEEAVLIGGDFGTNIDASGFSGNVTLLGNGGGDTLIGGSGNDVLGGGDGNDKLFGLAGNDTADGAAGNDSLVGGDGDDVLLGGAANDTLLGQGGDDTLLGEDGNDSIDGGSEIDTATGVGNGEPDDDIDTISNAETIDNTFMFDFDSLVAGF